MVEEGIKAGICHAIHRYATANNKYMRNHNKGKESLYLVYWSADNLEVWVMSQKLPIENLKGKRNSSEFDEEFIKN